MAEDDANAHTAASSSTPGPATTTTAATDNAGQPAQNNSTPAVTGTSSLPQASAASTSSNQAGTSSASAGPSSASSSNSLNTIDDVCNAIITISLSGGDANAQYKTVSQLLVPALQQLENRGTHLGVPGSVVLCSALQGNHDPLQALLTQIPPAGLGAGYLFILVARCYADDANGQYLVNYIMQYIQAADPYQLRLVPQKVTALAGALLRFMSSQPADAIEPLMALNSKLQGNYRNYLTAIQPLILYAALQSNQYIQAIALLRDSPVSDVDTRSFPITYQDNLKYHLYGGIIMAVYRDYEHAAQLLETAVSAPCHTGASSLLQIDAYKHLILAQLLKDGKTTTLPKYTSSNLLSTFRQLYTTPYLDFAKAYEALDSHRLADLVTQHRKVFEQDQTLGLVLRCMHMIPSRKIIKLGNTYKTIEIEEVVRLIDIIKNEANTTGEAAGQIALPDIEQAKAFVRQAVQNLVNERKLTAIIKPAPAPGGSEYLEFLTVRPTPAESALALQRSLAMLKNSAWTVSHLDKNISASKEFLGKAYAAVGRVGPGGNAGGMMEQGFEMTGFHPGGMPQEEELLNDRDMHDNDIWDD
ncbi:hypothetical protein P389DRAFT_93346 [Cystobasidium minutum MCA 4210]|uniref:uncharacterized protein n=1 Tax=Cystobasidium minutum MCA 4210 TaxID=1397322 RepID=UPI0034CE4AAA|eukprot:jgi/Rhomi1/93346/CE93345_1368